VNNKNKNKNNNNNIWGATPQRTQVKPINSNMENQNNSSLGTQLLPGDRQGASGATAGSDSMWGGGGSLLNRWTTTIQNDTAETINGTQEQQTITAERVSQTLRPETTKDGHPRQRKKWDNETNEFILRCYCRVTNLETNLTGYRQQLHALFIERYPEWSDLTEQRITDQCRVIKRNRLVPVFNSK
jgi:hypothetical protein